MRTIFGDRAFPAAAARESMERPTSPTQGYSLSSCLRGRALKEEQCLDHPLDDWHAINDISVSMLQ